MSSRENTQLFTSVAISFLDAQAQNEGDFLKGLADASQRQKMQQTMLLHSLSTHRPGLLLRAAMKINHRLKSRIQVRILRNSGLVDPEWYTARYDDVRKSGADPAQHYYHHGAAEGRDPGPDFSTEFYTSAYPDVVAAGINPLLHFVMMGHAEGRLAQPARTASSRSSIAWRN